MGDIRTNFSRWEFACPCGCGFDVINIEVVSLCELARELDGGQPVRVNSGCRCAEHNKAVDGEDESQHLIGNAADLQLINTAMVYSKLCTIFPDRYGFGLYDLGVHIDCRRQKARW